MFFYIIYDKKNILIILFFDDFVFSYLGSEWETIFLNTSTKRVYVPKPLIKKCKMENVFGMIKGFFTGVSDLLITFLSVGVLVQVLFGGPVFGMDVVGNVTALIDSLGNSGFVGLIAVILLLKIVDRK